MFACIKGRVFNKRVVVLVVYGWQENFCDRRIFVLQMVSLTPSYDISLVIVVHFTGGR